MSTQLMKYLLADAREVKDTGPSPYEGDSSNLKLALRRHGPIHHARDRNRLSLDLEKCYDPSKDFSSTSHSKEPVKYRRSGSGDIAPSGSRHSLNLEMLLNRVNTGSGSSPRRRTVHFDVPEVSAGDSIRKYYDETHDSDKDESPNTRSRRRRRTTEESPKAEYAALSPQLARLMDIKPRNYAEAQRLKKMLKRAVSGPNTTFEDLKFYRVAMKRLRRVIREEQEKEIARTEEEIRDKEVEDFINKIDKVNN